MSGFNFFSRKINYKIMARVKHYDFLSVIFKTIGISKEDIETSIEIKEIHHKFLEKYNLDKLINWYF